MDWDRGIDEEEIRQLQEIEEGEVPRGWRPSQETVHAMQEGKPRQESCAEARESELKAKIHYHHIYPKFRGNEKYSSFFEELGINVDQWTVAVNEETHLKYVHNETVWNEVWKAWIDEHRGEVTAEEVLRFGRQLLTHFGLEGLWEGDANPRPSYDVPDDEIYSIPPRRK